MSSERTPTYLSSVWRRIRENVLDEIKAARAVRLELIRNGELSRADVCQLHCPRLNIF